MNQKTTQTNKKKPSQFKSKIKEWRGMKKWEEIWRCSASMMAELFMTTAWLCMRLRLKEPPGRWNKKMQELMKTFAPWYQSRAEPSQECSWQFPGRFLHFGSRGYLGLNSLLKSDKGNHCISIYHQNYRQVLNDLCVKVKKERKGKEAWRWKCLSLGAQWSTSFEPEV